MEIAGRRRSAIRLRRDDAGRMHSCRSERKFKAQRAAPRWQLRLRAAIAGRRRVARVIGRFSFHGRLPACNTRPDIADPTSCRGPWSESPKRERIAHMDTAITALDPVIAGEQYAIGHAGIKTGGAANSIEGDHRPWPRPTPKRRTQQWRRQFQPCARGSARAFAAYRPEWRKSPAASA